MRIAQPGLKFAGIGAVVFLGGFVLAAAGQMSQSPFLIHAGSALGSLGFVFAAFCAFFFRDPERHLPDNPSRVYAPGDGVVLSVNNEKPGGGPTVRIFLSLFDVHIQRLPVAGTVRGVKFETGPFKAAMKPEAKNNARCLVTLEPEGRPASDVLEVSQITGLVARRIACWFKEGQSGRAGERYGMIYFGSQVAVALPPSVSCLVKPGDRVVGGETAIGEWKS